MKLRVLYRVVKMKVNTIVVLCAGNGSRMQPFTNYYPKTLLPIKNHIALELLLEEMLAVETENIVVVVNSRDNLTPKLVKKFLQEKSLKIPLKIVRQQERSGAGGALLLAKEHIKGNFLLGFGDDITKSKTSVSVQLVKAFNLSQKNVMAVRKVSKTQAKNYGVVLFDKKQKNLPKQIIEKPQNVNCGQFVNFGRYVLKQDFFDVLKTVEKQVNGEVYLTNAFKKLIENKSLVALKFKGKTFDVGNMNNYIKSFKKY